MKLNLFFKCQAYLFIKHGAYVILLNYIMSTSVIFFVGYKSSLKVQNILILFLLNKEILSLLATSRLVRVARKHNNIKSNLNIIFARTGEYNKFTDNNNNYKTRRIYNQYPAKRD
jgi:hypothetical protein